LCACRFRSQNVFGIQFKQRTNRRAKHDEQAAYKHDCNLFCGHNPSFFLRFAPLILARKTDFRNTRAIRL
jgi:hypothetical protein